MRLAPLPFVLVALAACTSYRPPFTEPSGASVQADPHQATVVFLWPVTSCDPAGYLTLATADGRFIGNLPRGSRLSVLVPAGESTFVAWNDLLEKTGGWTSKATVPVLHADLREGRTYYARVLFGDWDENGPSADSGPHDPTRVVRARPLTSRRCAAVQESTTSAMLALSPALEGWDELSTWLQDLDTVAPDRVAGQAWLDANHALLGAHVAAAHDRFAAFPPPAKRLATLEPFDGEPR